MAVLPEPVVLAASELIPIAVLLQPLVIANRLQQPMAMFEHELVLAEVPPPPTYNDCCAVKDNELPDTLGEYRAPLMHKPPPSIFNL